MSLGARLLFFQDDVAARFGVLQNLDIKPRL
jgi:hypothetical protein